MKRTGSLSDPLCVRCRMPELEKSEDERIGADPGDVEGAGGCV